VRGEPVLADGSWRPLRNECLDQHGFASLEQLKQTVAAWRSEDHPGRRPSGAWTAVPGCRGSSLDTATEGSGLPLQVVQSGGRSSLTRSNVWNGPSFGEPVRLLLRRHASRAPACYEEKDILRRTDWCQNS
jgi:hypothetical protein